MEVQAEAGHTDLARSPVGQEEGSWMAVLGCIRMVRSRVALRLHWMRHVDGTLFDRHLRCQEEVDTAIAARLVAVDSHRSDPDTTSQDLDNARKLPFVDQ